MSDHGTSESSSANDPADLVKVVQEAIDRGARTVEEVHLTVAALPLQALRQLGPFEEVADRADDILHTSIGSVYDSILAVNRRVGEIAEGLLRRGERAPE